MYRGSGKKGKGPCQKEACNIQWCLARRNHDQSKCQEFVEAWKRCEERAKQAQERQEAEA